MISALIAGSLYRRPEARTSKAGKPFTSATVKAVAGDKSHFIRVTAFDAEVCTALAALDAGDAVAVAGRLDAEIYKPEGGEPRVSLSLIAERVISAPQPRRQKGAGP